MINYSKNLLNLPVLYLGLFCKLRFQRKFIQDTLLKDIQDSRSTNDGTLEKQDYTKMSGYYGYAVPVIFGESYGVLRGKSLTDSERMALTYLGGLTGLFDDFFDKKDLQESYIRQMIEYPEKYQGNNSFEHLILRLYRKTLEYIPDPAFMKNHFLEVHHAQVESKKQKDIDLTVDELNAITLHKGGVSMLLFRNIFPDILNEPEKMLFYKLGGLFQLENDIFDVYKDSVEGIKTVVTTEKKINNLRKHYSSLLDDIFQLVQQTGYPAKNKKSFKRIIYLVYCRGLVCLDQLERNEQLTGDVFYIAGYERSELICDMEKPENILKWHHYYSTYNFNSNY